MSNNRKSDWLIYAALTVLALLLAALGAYVGCYFGMSETHFQRWDEDEDGGVATLRFYDTQWQSMIFIPAGKVESLLTRRQVVIVADGGESWSSY